MSPDFFYPARFGIVAEAVPSFWRRWRLDMDLQMGDLLRVSRTGELVEVEHASEGFVDVRRGVASIACPIEAGDEVLYVGCIEGAAR